jgi:hypothetical protein
VVQPTRSFRSRLSFLDRGAASDGPVSDNSPTKPSKPTLLYATLHINNTPLQTLIDTGASATCISEKALHRMHYFHYVDQTPSSFLLADGVVLLKVRGLVSLSMMFASDIIHFYAFVTDTLCIDLILGMDFMITYQANIDVKFQRFSIEHFGKRSTIAVDDCFRRPLVPLHSSETVVVPPRSILMVHVSSPISFFSGYFSPTSTFLEHLHLSSAQKTVTVEQHAVWFSVVNTSHHQQTIPQYFCFGYLLSLHSQPSYTQQLSALCDKYNDRRNKLLAFFPSPPLFTQPRLIQKNCLPSAQSPFTTSIIPPNMIASTFSAQLQQDLCRLAEKVTDNNQQTRVLSLFRRFAPIFDTSKHNISNIVIEHVFNTVQHSPLSFRPLRNPHHRAETEKLIDEFLQAGIIQESSSPYAAPAFIVPRKDHRPGRLVVDYRALNKITIPDASPLPNIEDTLQDLGKGFCYFSKLDLKNGYHQFLIPEADRQKTAFVISTGHYEFLTLPMGPTNGPPCFQKTMSHVMFPCRDFSRIYLDDLIIYSRSFDEHVSHLETAFSTLAKHKIVLSPSKCEIAVTSVEFLGHVISADSVTPNNDAIQAIIDLKEPHTLKQANKFLGGLAYYRKFVPHFAHIAAPIHKVTNLTKDKKRTFFWSTEQSQAFCTLKRLLTTAPLYLRFPIDGYPLHLTTDASKVATGGVLYQDVKGERWNIFYHSKVLGTVEKTYTVPELEALAIFHCLQRMRTYVLGRTVHIHTDHCPICGIMDKPVNNRRIERVANLIQQCHIAEMTHISGKSNCLADFLSRPYDDDPLFDIPYGVESKRPFAHSSPSAPTLSTGAQFVSTMTLRSHVKPSLQDVNAENSDVSDAESGTASFHSTTTSPSTEILISPSPNAFNSDDLRNAQRLDPAIQIIITNVCNQTDQLHSSPSFVFKNTILYKLLTLSAHSQLKTAVPYLPASLIKPLLTAMHDDPYLGGSFFNG